MPWMCSTGCRVSRVPALPAATWCATLWWPASSTPTNRPVTMCPEFALSVQYAAELPELPRWRVRRWVARARSEEHTSELQSLMRSSYAVFCLKKKNEHKHDTQTIATQPDITNDISTQYHQYN